MDDRVCANCGVTLADGERIDTWGEDDGIVTDVYECGDCGYVTARFRHNDLLEAEYQTRDVYERARDDGESHHVRYGDTVVLPPDLYERILDATVDYHRDDDLDPGHRLRLSNVVFERGGSEDDHL